MRFTRHASTIFVLLLMTAILADEPGKSPQPVELEVTHHGTGTSVEKHVLKGRAESFPAGTTVVYWTRVLGGRPGVRIRHVWIYAGKEISIGLAIGGHHWRTYSSKRIALEQTGEWIVEARDTAGKVLSRRKFTVVAE